MNILAVGHSWVVNTFRKLLTYFADIPDVAVTLVTPDYWKEGGRKVYAAPTEQDNFTFRIVRPITHRQHLHVYLRMPGIIRQVKPDILFLLEEPNSLVTATTLIAAKRYFPESKAICYTFLNDDRDFSRMSGLRKFLFPWAQNVSFRLSDGLACASQASKKQMQKRGYKKDIRVIPFGTDIQASPPAPSIVHKLRQTIAGEHDFVIGFVGRLTPGKGVDILLKAVAALPGRQGIRLVLIGDGEELTRMKYLAKDLEILERISFIGSIPHDRVKMWMKTFDVLVVPSRRHGHWVEQFGRVVVEGMASKILIIGSDSGEIPIVIGSHGWIFRENDWQDLRNTLQMVRHLPLQQRGQIVEETYQYALQHFDYECLSRLYYNWFQHLGH